MDNWFWAVFKSHRCVWGSCSFTFIWAMRMINNCWFGVSFPTTGVATSAKYFEGHIREDGSFSMRKWASNLPQLYASTPCMCKTFELICVIKSNVTNIYNLYSWVVKNITTTCITKSVMEPYVLFRCDAHVPIIGQILFSLLQVDSRSKNGDKWYLCFQFTLSMCQFKYLGVFWSFQMWPAP